MLQMLAEMIHFQFFKPLLTLMLHIVTHVTSLR